MKKPSSGYRRRLVVDVKDRSVEAGDNDGVGGVEQLADRRGTATVTLDGLACQNAVSYPQRMLPW